MKTLIKSIKYFIGTNLLTIVSIALLVVFTALLLEQRELLLINREDEKVEAFALLEMEEWEQYYGGGFGVDSVVYFEGEDSIRVASGATGGWYGARTSLEGSPLDLSDKSVRFAFRMEDWRASESVLLIFGTDDGQLQNYYSFNIKQYFAGPEAGEWHEVVVNRSDFEVAEGSPDWTHVTDVAVRLVGEEGIATRVWLDGFATVQNQGSPVVTLTFDDGFDSVVDAEKIMDTYGFKGTLFVIPEYLGQEGYLTQENVDTLHNNGWDISGHGATSLRLLEGYGDIDTALASMYEYLDSHSYTGKEHFAYPNGAYNTSVRSLVAEYFTSARTIDGMSQPQGYIVPTKVNAKTVSVNTTKEEIKQWVDDSIRDGSWLVITWHDISEEAEEDTQYPTQDFVEIVQYIKDSGAEVLPYSRAYGRIANAQ